ncbi:MAG TPA: NAD(P)-dependent oxidoreductase [Bacillus sp. (in: firmicutes)]|nr:NAD(P)-dependent oxidoreductase [Bacillus sp. (in: firmicutes)]
MKKIAVVGANRFVGFGLCDYFLKEGMEVIGYTHQAHERERMLQEEMEMFLGRNANFIVKKIEDGEVLFGPTDQFDVIYFTYFDQGDFQDTSFFREKMKQAHQVLVKCISYCLQSKTKLVFVSSMRVFGSQQTMIGEDVIPRPDHREGRLFLHLEKMVTKFSAEDFPHVIVRIPTVYGPWQPLTAAYQQACVQHVTKKHSVIQSEEDTRDVLFIDDVVQSLAGCRSQSPSSIIHFSSGKVNGWEQGADLLQVPYEPKVSTGSLSLNKKEELFSCHTGMEEGIRRQKLHTRQILSRYRFR